MPDGTRKLFEYYTVVCSLFRLQESRLWAATAGGQGVGNTITYRDCELMLDEIVLRSLLMLKYSLDSPARFQAAKRRIERNLEDIIEELQQINLAAAEEFEVMLLSFRDANIPLQCSSAVQNAMDTAREAARTFFQASPWKHTRSRIRTRNANNWRLDFVVERGDNSPMYYHNAEIHLRFGPDCRYSSYWLWPMVFMHEFCSHVYGEDNNLSHLRFTEGWLTYAAAYYFEQMVVKKNFNGPAFGPQAGFLSKVRETLNSNAQEAWDLALAFHVWASENHPSSFDDLTLELAAFQPSSERDVSWPDEFLDRLDYTCSLHSPRLAVLIRQSEKNIQRRKRVCAEKLMPLLSERPRPRRIAALMAD